MSRDDLMEPWHGFCIAAGRRPAMMKTSW